MQLKKIMPVLMISMCLVFGGIGEVMAQSVTVLPKVGNQAECDNRLNAFLLNGQKPGDSVEENELLACAIVSGRISLSMVPYFIKYFSNFALGMVGIVSVLFVVIGGYFYTLAGAMESAKEKGKKYISHALVGMILAFSAWTIVNVVLRLITG